MQIPTVRRSNRKHAFERFRTYDHEAWLARAADHTDPSAEDVDLPAIVVTQGVDFHTAPASFIQDLHRIARLFTDASTDQPPTGYIVRTTRKGLTAEQVGFLFYKVPRAEARGSDDVRPRAARAAAQTAYGISPAVAAKTGLPATPAPPTYAEPTFRPVDPPQPEPVTEPAIEAPAVDTSWCNGNGSIGWHKRGQLPPGVTSCACTGAETAHVDPATRPAAEPVERADAGGFPAPPPFIPRPWGD